MCAEKRHSQRPGKQRKDAHIMPTIYCPNCEQVIPENTAICENCGYDLASDMKTEQSAEETKKVPAGTGKNLSEDEIQKLIAGNLVDLTMSEEEIAKASAGVEGSPEEEAVSDVISEEAAADIVSAAESIINESEGVPAEEAPDEPAEEVTVQEPAADTAEEKKKEKNPFPLFVLTTVGAAVVSIGIGFLICFLLFCLENVSFESDFSFRAAKAVQSTYTSGEKLVVYDAYVKFDPANTECVLLAVLQTDAENSAMKKYRVVVDNNDSHIVNVYYELSEEDYKLMKESQDSKISIQASVLKNYSDMIDTALENIASGSRNWFRADSNYVNEQLEIHRSEQAAKTVQK